MAGPCDTPKYRRIVVVSFLAIIAACGAEPNELVASSDDVAQRVVTLAPHLAELMFDIGAEHQLVGVSAYTDYPPQALELPIIGDAFVVDREQLAILKPDLLLAWASGTPQHVIDQLRQAGYRVEAISTQGVGDVADALLAIGELTGHSQRAQDLAIHYSEQVAAMAAENQHTEAINVFYQIQQRPLYTVNGKHYISELIEICGGVNIFADIGDLAPLIDVEAVIDRDPEVMLAGEDSRREAFDEWDRWPNVAANRYGNRFFMPAAEIGRATTRLTIAAQAVCDALDIARANRRKHKD